MHVQLFLFIPCVFSQLQLAWISQILQLYLCRVPFLPWQAQGILSWAVLGLDSGSELGWYGCQYRRRVDLKGCEHCLSKHLSHLRPLKR